MECVICYEVIGDTNKCVTPCGHNFCFNCIMRSTQYNSSCPYCRAELQEPAVVDDDESTEYESDEDDSDDNDSITHIMFDDRDIYESDMGSFDENGFYKLPLTIETMDELKDTLDTMVPDGYTKLFKNFYLESSLLNQHPQQNEELFLKMRKHIPGFTYKDMIDEPVNIAYIEYSKKKEESEQKCYEIFYRTRKIMNVIRDKTRLHSRSASRVPTTLENVPF